jgi:hypothetical protein
MYYPYFRGKQFDLITLRDCAGLMADAGFVPIVEPVKESLSGLRRSIDAINEAGGEMILIVNPANGEHAGNFDALSSLVKIELKDHINLSPGILLTLETSIADIVAMFSQYSDRLVTLIHSGFTGAKLLAEYLTAAAVNVRHVFIDDQCGVSYTKHFKNAQRVLIRNGFERRANRAHPEIEKFSELHATFGELGMDGFGDFLIVGDEFSVTGGPAYSVAIHLTCIDSEHDDVMLIHHFKSIRYDTPTDPAGKFAEAVQKLVDEVDRPGTLIYRTKAVSEFYGLHLSGHFPGLGYVKKLSMNHHIETLAEYFKRAK